MIYWVWLGNFFCPKLFWKYRFFKVPVKRGGISSFQNKEKTCLNVFPVKKIAIVYFLTLKKAKFKSRFYFRVRRGQSSQWTLSQPSTSWRHGRNTATALPIECNGLYRTSELSDPISSVCGHPDAPYFSICKKKSNYTEIICQIVIRTWREGTWWRIPNRSDVHHCCRWRRGSGLRI